MSSNRLECNCGHRLALHTYFKNRTPCTLCRCDAFETEPILAASSVRPARDRRGDRYVSSADPRSDAERRPL